MFCSTIIPTIGRPTLARAVQSVLEQNLTAADFEVIVVNDSEKSLSEEDWQKDERVRVLDASRPALAGRQLGAGDEIWLAETNLDLTEGSEYLTTSMQQFEQRRQSNY